ncbi:hypothetical protein HPB50_029549 [Hyalomma asiaticum]|nr:hypothetical protein HPB50_029549 [Hyalomma asiaticum]
MRPSRVYPYTFFGRVPRGVNDVEMCTELVKRFPKTDLLCVQDFGGGKFEVSFRNMDAVNRFLADPVLTIRGRLVRFRYLGVQA